MPYNRKIQQGCGLLRYMIQVTKVEVLISNIAIFIGIIYS
nr:MAG TPA: hypothetical protein [Caudoviricetes sp.]